MGSNRRSVNDKVKNLNNFGEETTAVKSNLLIIQTVITRTNSLYMYIHDVKERFQLVRIK